MIFRYHHVRQHPRVFQAVTGLRLNEFDQLVSELLSAYAEADHKRLDRKDRQRAIGGGRDHELDVRDQILLTVVWLRKYPTQEVLGYLYGVSDTTAGRVIKRVLPLLEAAGRDTMRLPDPGRKNRRSLPDLLADTPELAVVIDTFEQRVQRHKDRDEADQHYSGKKRQNTLKSQIAVNEFNGFNGLFVDVADSVPGPTADIKLLEKSDLLNRLPSGLGAIGDLAHTGIDKLHRKMSTARKIVLVSNSGYDPSHDDLLRSFIDRKIELFCAVGRQCEVWEAIMDAVVVGPAGDFPWHVTTTSHPGETVADVVTFAESFSLDKPSEVEVIEV